MMLYLIFFFVLFNIIQKNGAAANRETKCSCGIKNGTAENIPDMIKIIYFFIKFYLLFCVFYYIIHEKTKNININPVFY